MDDIRPGWTTTRTRTFGYEQHSVKVTVTAVVDFCRDPWTGETGPGVCMTMEDTQTGTSYHTLLRPLFEASWVR